MARPSKYKKEFCELLIDHMSKGHSIESFPAVIYKEFGIKISRDSIYEWATSKPEFSDSKKVGEAASLKFYEEKIIFAMETGVKGFPTAGWVFSMKNRFRWRDTPEETTQDDRPTLADIMKSVEKNARNNTTKKRKPSKRTAKRSRSSH